MTFTSNQTRRIPIVNMRMFTIFSKINTFDKTMIAIVIDALYPISFL